MLQIKSVSKLYDNGVQALNNVSLEIPTGMFGLLGPNGAGKSSLMRTIATLQQCDSGSIVLDEIDVLSQPQEARKQLGYLPQDFGVYPQFSPQTMLNHFAALKGISQSGERKETVQGLLAMVNLWDVRNQKLGTFSGGMRQRFGVAHALLGNPRLVIVDEPTAGLDPEERQRLLNLLSEISEKAIILLSTHLVKDVRDLCSNMAIVDKGRILSGGDPQNLIDELEGKVWSSVVDKSEVSTYRVNHRVLSTRLFAGRIAIRVVSDTSPGPQFVPINADLEDGYFFVLNNSDTNADYKA